MTQNNPKGTRAILVIIIFLLLLSGSIYWKINSNEGQASGAGPGGPQGGKNMPQKVTGFIARKVNIPMILESSGSLLAWNEVQLMPEMAGRITQMAIKEGMEVSEGQLLVKIFDEDLKAQLRKQELQAKIAAKNLERLRDLLKINGISQQELDIAENNLNNIETEMDLIRANLKKTEIRAPFSGKIGLTNASQGSFASMGNQIASLQQLNMLKVEFSIPEKYSNLLSVGDLVSFTLESRSDTFRARVYAFEPKIDVSNRSLKVRAQMENKGYQLMPGSFARVKIRLREIKNAVIVPNESLIPDTRGQKVIVYRNGQAEFVKVETGIRNADMVQIINGVASGDTIINTGLMFVKPNSSIILTGVK